MKGAFGKTFAHQFCRCNGSAGDEHGTLRFSQQRVDQRQHGQAFADTRAMNPDELSLRACESRFSKSFGEAESILFAAARARAKHYVRCRRKRLRRCAIDREW